MARKHQVDVNQLSGVLIDFQQKLKALDLGDAALSELSVAEQKAKMMYQDQAKTLHEKRLSIGEAIDQAVQEELAPLKLEKAKFKTQVVLLNEDKWSADGMNEIAFEVSTNPGMPLSPIHKIASGGELARFMLAIKVVLAKTSSVSSMVFDEVDTGIGGATAAAVGDRLSRLSDEVQVMVVTHSPQVAAEGEHHFKIDKKGDQKASTIVQKLLEAQRREEIARMLSADEITEEARRAADRLLY